MKKYTSNTHKATWRYYCHACTNAAFYRETPETFKGTRQCLACHTLLSYEADKWLPNK